MEISWNIVSPEKWEPCTLNVETEPRMVKGTINKTINKCLSEERSLHFNVW